MKPNDQQNPDLANKERQIRGIQELGMSAATAVGAIKMIEQVAEAAERKVVEVAEKVAVKEQQDKILKTGEKIVATQALITAEEQQNKIKSETEAKAKATYDTMIKQRMEAEEKKKKQKKSFKVSAPSSSSVLTKVAKGALDPTSMYQFFIPGSGFLADALKKIL